MHFDNMSLCSIMKTSDMTKFNFIGDGILRNPSNLTSSSGYRPPSNVYSFADSWHLLPI